jgi:hypothetical protein
MPSRDHPTLEHLVDDRRRYLVEERLAHLGIRLQRLDRALFHFRFRLTLTLRLFLPQLLARRGLSLMRAPLLRGHLLRLELELSLDQLTGEGSAGRTESALAAGRGSRTRFNTARLCRNACRALSPLSPLLFHYSVPALANVRALLANLVEMIASALILLPLTLFYARRPMADRA